MSAPFFIKTRADDSRVCLSWGAGLLKHADSGAANVTFALLRRPQDDDPQSVHFCTPAEAREIGMALWNMAAAADKIMADALAAAPEIKLSICDGCGASGGTVIVRSGEQWASCPSCEAARTQREEGA